MGKIRPIRKPVTRNVTASRHLVTELHRLARD
jgi:hypothetical protein